MTLPASGQIALSCVNTELGNASTDTISLNQCTVRTLFGKSSGQISMSDGYGKSNIVKGSAAYTTAGTYCWVAPSGVNRVSVVAIGAGGAGATGWCGGGGGALAYTNNITVTPKSSYSVTVGTGGQGGPAQYCAPMADRVGYASKFQTTVVAEGGGSKPCYNSRIGGSTTNSTGTVKYAGGFGGGYNAAYSGGGAGAGGYAGAGGQGSSGGNDCGFGTPAAGSGAGGGGAGGRNIGCNCYPQYKTTSSGGGGTGLYGGTTAGQTGYRGSPFAYNATSPGAPPPTGGRGGGGGGGNFGGQGTGAFERLYLSNQNPNGGSPGGGGGTSTYGRNVGYGGTGGVRIIYPGCSRAFPCTCAVSP